MEQVGCSVVMLHCAAVRKVCYCTVCTEINTYRSGAIKMWMFLTAKRTGSFLVTHTNGQMKELYCALTFRVRMLGIPNAACTPQWLKVGYTKRRFSVLMVFT